MNPTAPVTDAELLRAMRELLNAIRALADELSNKVETSQGDAASL